MARRTTKAVEPAAVDAAAETAEISVMTAAETAEDAEDAGQAKPNKTGLTLGIGAILGIGAAALGYAAALQFPLSSPTPASADFSQLSAKIDAIDLSGIESRLAALENAPPVDLASIQSQITALQEKLAAQPANDDLRAQLSQLAAKVAQSDPAPAIKAAIAAEMGAVQKAAQDMAAAVADAAKSAEIAAAMTQLRAALDTGAPYASVAQTLALPDILAQNAAAGIPSLTQLRDGFAPAARAGLDAALRGDMGQTWGERATNFLRGQTGARSLTPRQGNDPDAVLSRIQAGLNSADLSASLAEVAALPDAARMAMADWLGLLTLRMDALAAFDALTKDTPTEKGN